MSEPSNPAQSSKMNGWHQKLKALMPGFALALMVGICAKYLSEHYGGSVMLYALLIGMAFHFLYEEGACREGIAATSRIVLRLGVALLGLRISLDQVMSLGGGVLLLVVGAVLGSLACGLIIARMLGRPASFGLLTGGSVGICGASAAMAISSVLPENKQTESDTLFTVIAVTTLSTIAMVLYPSLGAILGLDDREMGMMLGATIHDVAQVVGAGYAVSDEAGDVATIVKLMRVMMLLPVIFLVSIIMTRWALSSRDRACRTAPVPWFAFVFAALVIVNSLGWVPETPRTLLIDLSRWCLIIAIAALGIMTTLKSILSLGAGHIMVVVVETIILLLGVLLAIHFLL